MEKTPVQIYPVVGDMSVSIDNPLCILPQEDHGWVVLDNGNVLMFKREHQELPTGDDVVSVSAIIHDGGEEYLFDLTIKYNDKNEIAQAFINSSVDGYGHLVVES